MTTTRETTVDQLTEGDTVYAVGGFTKPFPYTVTRIVRTKLGKQTFIRVEYAHGGLEMPRADFHKITATVAA